MEHVEQRKHNKKNVKRGARKEGTHRHFNRTNLHGHCSATSNKVLHDLTLNKSTLFLNYGKWEHNVGLNN